MLIRIYTVCHKACEFCRAKLYQLIWLADNHNRVRQTLIFSSIRVSQQISTNSGNCWWRSWQTPQKQCERLCPTASTTVKLPLFLIMAEVGKNLSQCLMQNIVKGCCQLCFILEKQLRMKIILICITATILMNNHHKTLCVKMEKFLVIIYHKIHHFSTNTHKMITNMLWTFSRTTLAKWF